MPRGRKLNIKNAENQVSLSEAAEDFFKNNKAKSLAEATQYTYVLHVNRFMRWAGSEMLVSDVTPGMLDDYLVYQQERGNKAVSVATIMRHLRRFFNFCNSRGYMEKIDITIPRYETTLKEPYTDKEMKRLLAKPRSGNWVELRSWCMINYFYATGQRLSTVLNIRIKDLDLSSGKVRLVWNKDKIQKWMPLSTAIIKVLREYIYLSRLDDDDYLFPEYEGGQLSRKSAQDAIARYNKKRGVKKTSIHLFRHTFAKNYIIAGGSPAKLQYLLNHKTVDMTMKYVNLYGSEVATDYDLFNPLDNLKRRI